MDEDRQDDPTNADAGTAPETPADRLLEGPTRPLEVPRPGPDERIGPYRILEIIGSGGMGEVYLAEQEYPICRRVAIKVIKIGMDTGEVIARFESERQAMAMMNHPNIAQILDAGSTAAGRPYFVMEHCPGVPITEYCDRHRVDTRERLELFATVCQAIQHAHQKGIIHRDIKPTNVLVTIQDGRAVPKVIDFGVAKAVSQRLTERTLFTRQGRLIGTPAYMSPEQAEMTGLDVDTTTDIYSLGVLLYEMLAGVLPFDPNDLLEAGLENMHRIIREVDPPTPSARVSKLGAAATEVAHRRRAEPAQLLRQIKGDLDWVTMRALEKDRTRRYPSASEFAADIRRHLAHELVTAGPRPLGYRLQLFARRHRPLVISTIVVLAALLAGFAVSTRLYLDTQDALDRERQQTYLATMRNASTALRDGDPVTLEQALERCPEGHRDWAWRYLVSRLDQSETVLARAGLGAGLVAVSPDGRWIATVREDSTRWLWDTTTDGAGVMVGAGIAHTGAGTVFTPDTDLLIGGDRDGFVRAWDVTTGEERYAFQAGQGPIRHLALHHSGALLATKAWDDSVRVWDLDSRKRRYAVFVKSHFWDQMNFTADGAWLVTGGSERPLRVWDASDGRLIREYDSRTPYDWAVTPSPDSDAVLCWAGNVICEWDQVNGEFAGFIKGDHGFTDLSFSPGGARLVTTNVTGEVEVWDPATGVRLATLRGHRGIPTGIAFLPGGDRFLTGGTDRPRFWRTKCPHGPALFPKVSVTAAAGNPDGRSFIVGLHDGVSGLDLLTGRFTPLLSGVGTATVLAVSQDGKHLALVGNDERDVSIWDMPPGDAPVHALTHPGGRVNDLAFGPHGALLATSTGSSRRGPAGGSVHSADHQIRLWDARTGELLWSRDPQGGAVNSVALSPDGRLLASGNWDGGVRLWDVSSGDLVAVLTEAQRGFEWSPVKQVVFSPGGDVIAACSENAVRIWSVADHRPVWQMQNCMPVSCAFSPDGRLFHLVDLQGDLVVRARPGYEQVCRVETGTSPWCMAMAPDGETLLLAVVRPNRSILLIDPRRWVTGFEESPVGRPGHG